MSKSKSETGLIKPPLAINMWGPKFADVSVPDELDHGKTYPEEMYSTFQHEKDEDCPAFKDKSKAVNDKPLMRDKKFKYPCNVGGCGKDCECNPCADNGPLLCPNHHPDHP